MGDKSKIEWTEATWNPVRGCSRVSAGCEHCYAEQVAHRFSGPGGPYHGLTVLGKKGPRWSGKIMLVNAKLVEPLRWTKPRRIFVNSMSDLFHEKIPFEYIAGCFGVMAAATLHTFQVLTKRPERAREFFEWVASGGRLSPGEPVKLLRRSALAVLPDMIGERFADRVYHCSDTWPLPNVWLGVSVEDQATADLRIPQLLDLPAAVHWVSYEPALGPVDFSRWLCRRETMRSVVDGSTYDVRSGIDWIVIGGESGRGARPFDLEWCRTTIADCNEAGVAVFAKQLGAITVDGAFKEKDGTPAFVGGFKDKKGGDWDEWPKELRVRQYPRETTS